VDQLGRTTSSVAITTGGHEIPTTFTYEPFGLLNTITDTYGNVMRTVHDIRGRPQVLNDPDSGDHFYQWNCYNELAQAQDGNGFYTTYVSDGIGRVKAITNKDGTAVFNWDTAPNGIGKLANATSTDGINTSYAYNPIGQLAGSSWTVGGNTFNLGLNYDPYGRLGTITYPSSSGNTGFSTQQNYNPYGYLSRVTNFSSGAMLWQTDSMNERSKITKEEFGNGVVTHRTYSPRGRAKTINSSGASGALQTLQYYYYPGGSLANRSNVFLIGGEPYSLSESFQFDPLDRISSLSSVGSLLAPVAIFVQRGI
jgi:YD repeat-containing protein